MARDVKPSTNKIALYDSQNLNSYARVTNEHRIPYQTRLQRLNLKVLLKQLMQKCYERYTIQN